MSKIKEISTRLHKNPQEYSILRFVIAKQIFCVIAFFYFATKLFTIGGFYFWPFDLKALSTGQYHLYSVFIIATVFFWYSIIEYISSLYMNNSLLIKIIALIIGIWFGGIALWAHLGFLHF